MFTKCTKLKSKIPMVYGVLLGTVIAAAPAAWAADITRLSDSGNQAGDVTRITAVGMSLPHVVTAIRDGTGRLKLIGWETAATATTRKGDSGNQGGPVEEIAAINAGYVVTAVTTPHPQNRLRLTSWRVLTNSDPWTIERLKGSGNQAGEASDISITRVPAPTTAGVLLVTAVRTPAGYLKLIAWDMSGDGTFTRLGDSGSTNIADTETKITAISSNILVTAVKNNGLKLHTWHISSDGQTITKIAGSGNQASNANHVYGLTPVSGGVLTAHRIWHPQKKRLRLLRWAISQDGSVIDRIGGSGNQAGEGSQISLSRWNHQHYVTGMMAANGKFKLILWKLGGGGSISRIADSGNQVGTVSGVSGSYAITRELYGQGHLVSAISDSDADLKVITWGVNP